MKRRIGLCLMAGLASFVACGCIAVPARADEPTPAPAAGDKTAQIERGRQAFIGNGCGWCHADGGRKEGRCPQLMDDTHDDDFLINRIATGSAGRMPSFGQSLQIEDINAIITYIRNLKP
jgi:mono/diheme cytochrome c family protein